MEKEKKTRRSKKDLPPTAIRSVLAHNIRTMRDRKWASLSAVTSRNKALAAALHTGLPQAQRLVDGVGGPSVDTVERIADIFGVRPQDMLTPYFGAEKEHPPASVPADGDDRAELHPGQNRHAPKGPRKL